MPLIPMVIEQTARGERLFDIYFRLLGERIPRLRPQVRRHRVQLHRGDARDPHAATSAS